MPTRRRFGDCWLRGAARDPARRARWRDRPLKPAVTCVVEKDKPPVTLVPE